MESLFYARVGVLIEGVEGAVQSVAGFASLHCAITLLVALMVQYTLRSRVLHWIFWTNFVITIVATLYFGWHYVADDVAGILIALDRLLRRRHRQRAEVRDDMGWPPHPTTTTSRRPRRAGPRTLPQPDSPPRNAPLRPPARCISSGTIASLANYNLVVRQADTPVDRRKSWGKCFFCD